ncbi:MAG: hypothetical protein ABIN36_11475 [Ferruginibacter sp.]
MKTYFLIALFSFAASQFAQAQCDEFISDQQLQPGMFAISKLLKGDSHDYVAEITAVAGETFECRFLHSNSEYKFVECKKSIGSSKSSMQAKVHSNKGGKYSQGTLFEFNFFMASPEPCNFDLMNDELYYVIAEFPDRKSYLGRMERVDENFVIEFRHSGSVYTLNKNRTVIAVRGGTYAKGDLVILKHARRLIF